MNYASIENDVLRDRLKDNKEYALNIKGVLENNRGYLNKECREHILDCLKQIIHG